MPSLKRRFHETGPLPKASLALMVDAIWVLTCHTGGSSGVFTSKRNRIEFMPMIVSRLSRWNPNFSSIRIDGQFSG